jgi:hemoglobin
MRASLAVLLLLASVACARPPWSKTTLYDDLGGQAGIARIVGALIEEIAADPRIVAFFDDTDIPRFEQKLCEQLCAISGGPCTYTGDDMRSVHAGLGIGPAHMNALVEDLQRAMRRSGVSWRVQNQLLAKLAPMHRDIVDIPPDDVPPAEPAASR